MVAAVAALAMLAWPVSAQIIPTIPTSSPEPAQTAERVVMDMTLTVEPGEHVGFCFMLDSGSLSISTQAKPSEMASTVGPPILSFGPFRNHPAEAGSPPEIEQLRVTAARTVSTLPITGGAHCLNIFVDSTTETDLLRPDDRIPYRQFVAVTMALTPQ
jgi:hypothetical protein